MGRREMKWLVWLLASALVGGLAGCMADDASGMVTDAGGGNGSRCEGGQIRFVPPSPVEGDLVKAELVVDGTLLSVRWAVTGPDGHSVSFFPRDEDRAVEFLADASGQYVVEASLETDKGFCEASGTVAVHRDDAKRELYRFVFTPADPSSFPRQETIVTVFQDSPISDMTFSLESGVLVHLAVSGPSGPLAAYVRLVPAGGELLLEGFYEPSGAPLEFRLDPDAAYDVFVVPQSPTVAPMVFRNQSTVFLAAQDPYDLALDAGRTVVGQVVDDGMQGIYGVGVTMSCGDRPSSLSQTDLTGRFALAARAGSCGLAVLPPAETGLPAAMLSSSAGLWLLQSGELDVLVRYAGISFGSVDVTVSYPDGTPAENANLIVTSQDASMVAEVSATVDGEEQGTWSATGLWRVTAVTDSQGMAHVGPGPSGPISILVEPARREYTSKLSVQLPLSDATSVDLSLSEPVEVHGRVFDAVDGERDMSSVVVKAVLREGTGATLSATCAPDGSFLLAVPFGVAFDLVMEPGRDMELVGRRIRGLVMEESGPVPGFPDGVPLERGLTVSGQVLGTNTGGALVQVFCSTCGEQDPVAETVVGSDGRLTVVVPNPR